MTMGEIIRGLRTRQGVTQEKLADYLGITYQAVSKWENNAGMPDISLVVPLASFFGVSPDTLFGWTEETEHTEAEGYHTQSKQFLQSGRAEENLALWRGATSKYPRNHRCLAGLMGAIHIAVAAGICEDGKNPDDMLEEALTLGQRILEDCTDGDLAGYARQLTVYILSMDGFRCCDHEKAAAMAEEAGDIHTCRQFLTRFAYPRGSEEYVRVNRELLRISLQTAADVLDRDTDYTTPEERLRAEETARMLRKLTVDHA